MSNSWHGKCGETRSDQYPLQHEETRYSNQGIASIPDCWGAPLLPFYYHPKWPAHEASNSRGSSVTVSRLYWLLEKSGPGNEQIGANQSAGFAFSLDFLITSFSNRPMRGHLGVLEYSNRRNGRTEQNLIYYMWLLPLVHRKKFTKGAP